MRLRLRIRNQPVVVEGEELAFYPDIYRRGIPSEAVSQALTAAGYDVSGITLPEVSVLLTRVRDATRIVRLPMRDAFASLQRAVDESQTGR